MIRGETEVNDYIMCERWYTVQHPKNVWFCSYQLINWKAVLALNVPLYLNKKGGGRKMGKDIGQHSIYTQTYFFWVLPQLAYKSKFLALMNAKIGLKICGQNLKTFLRH